MEKNAYLISEITCKGSEKIPVSSGGYYQFILIKTGSFFYKYAGQQSYCGIHEFLMLKPGTSLVLCSASGSFPKTALYSVFGKILTGAFRQTNGFSGTFRKSAIRMRLHHCRKQSDDDYQKSDRGFSKKEKCS